MELENQASQIISDLNPMGITNENNPKSFIFQSIASCFLKYLFGLIHPFLLTRHFLLAYVKIFIIFIISFQET